MQTAKAPETTILVADDEAFMRSLVERTLQRSGYQVLLAEDGDQALELAQSHPGEIKILLTDVRMPNMDGLCLAKKLRQIQPEVRVILMSGYFDQSLQSHEGWTFIRKPFAASMLQEIVRGALDQPVAPLDDLSEANGWLS